MHVVVCRVDTLSQSSCPIHRDSSNITFLCCFHPLKSQALRSFFVGTLMATRRDQKQQSNAKKVPSANPVREANASVGIAGNEDAPELTPLVAKANAETSVILAAINNMSKKMEDRFNNLEASLQATQTTLTEHYSWISTMEVACGDHDTRLTQLKQQYLQLDASHRLLWEKITELEARSRRQNIKVVGLPERAEGKNPVDFFANFL